MELVKDSEFANYKTLQLKKYTDAAEARLKKFSDANVVPEEPEDIPPEKIETKDSCFKKISIYGQLVAFPTVLLFIIMNETAIGIVSKIFAMCVYGIFLALTIIGPVSEKINAPTNIPSKFIMEIAKIISMYTQFK